MGSTLDKKKMVQDQGQNKYGFILAAIFVIWLFWPNNYSFIRLSYWSYNIFYNVAKFFNIEISSDSMHYRNNAVYLARINPTNPEPSLKSIKQALSSLPQKTSSIELQKLYRDSAVIRLFYGDKQGALKDYELADFSDPNDELRYAILLADNEKYDDALSHCKNVLIGGRDFASAGYACLAYVHQKAGNEASALQVFDWAISRNPKLGKLYYERGLFKKKIGDSQGALFDINKAKGISPDLNTEEASAIDKAIKMKKFPLELK